jgi:hypothetical protein
VSHYAECRYAECHYAECRYAECHYAECRYAECRYAECRYAECRYAERRGDLRLSHYIGRLHANIRFSHKKISDKRSSLIFRSVFGEEKKCFFKPLLGHGKILLSLFSFFS